MVVALWRGVVIWCGVFVVWLWQWCDGYDSGSSKCVPLLTKLFLVVVVVVV